MRRSILTAIVTAFSVMLLTVGCSSEKKDVTAAVEGFLNAMIKNDMEEASQYATEEFMKSDAMKMMDPEYLADTFYASMGVEKEDMGEEAQNAVNEYVKSVVDKAYKGFEIQDIKVQEGGTAAVTAKITLGYNPDASSGVPDETKEVVDQYQTDHYDELIAIYTEDGQKAMYNKIYNDLIPLVIGKMKEAIENSEPSEEKTILTLVNKDGKWLVNDLQENGAKAGTGDTSGETAAAAVTAEGSESAAEGGTSAEKEISSEDGTNAGAAAHESSGEESSGAGTT